MCEKLNIILNGKNIEGEKGESILQVAKRNGIEIPTLCNDDRLEPYSSCFVCVVEIEGARNLQPSCSTRIAEGMKIETENGRVKKARKTALDLLLSNHYADCVAPCKETCPAGVDVQGYISLIEKGLYSEAVGLIKQVNPLPAICGRVCVRPCEVACRRNLMGETQGVGIDYMKRFAADMDLASGKPYSPTKAPSTGKKVAIIGAGPGGLSSAYFLQQKGHQCDIFEAAPKPGGWLRYGIPEYRLPNDLLDDEISTITKLGVTITCGKKLGGNLSYMEIQEKYDATILTIGSQKGTLLGCKGEEAEGVYSGIDFLRNMEMTGQKYDFIGKKVIVVGGGNTAMDCCRTSLRCGSTDVKVVYRRTEKEMPANPIEIHESKLEGVEYLFLNSPVLVNGDENGKLKSVTVIKMELGEPDASGRQRPVPVEGSEYELEADYILAAIGQKTDINFLDDVNSNTKTGELKPNKWGDIDTNRKTLQTSIPSVFAAGDGVSGPATIIEAVAQAKIASRSCHNYLMGLPIESDSKEFVSRKDNFKEQTHDEYVKRYQRQLREEMPTLDSVDRVNFKEVELGYKDESIVRKETHRCLECGCTAYFTCDLKRYATKYEVDQKKYAGDYNEYAVDFSHPYIEMDNNKCILCSRCIRICKEVVGVSALGLVNRGYDTFVAPAMGDSLKDTDCESCGMCISACPTGAITENVFFKPGPVKLDEIHTIDNYTSEGASIKLFHNSNFFMRANGLKSSINPTGNIGRHAKFGYHYLNDKSRITRPLAKVNGKFEEISFEKAVDLIANKIKAVKPDENMFFGGARLTNEEQYLIQKFARAAVKTNRVGNFHYLGRGPGYALNSRMNVPFEQISGASRIYIIGSTLNYDNPLVNHLVFNASFLHNIPVELITTDESSSMINKVDKIHSISSYYHFIKAANHYLLTKGLENAMYIADNVDGFADYKSALLAEDFASITTEACSSGGECIEPFAEQYNNEQNAILIFTEKEVCSNTCKEIRNLAMITGKLGKTSNGIIAVKEKNNSQGIFDMGLLPVKGVGFTDIDDAFVQEMEQAWKVNGLSVAVNCQYTTIKAGGLKNMFIFGEDPIGCAIDRKEVSGWLNSVSFLVVQDYFMTDTTKEADLILPASFPIEIGGSFTNTQKEIVTFEKQMAPKTGWTSIEQLIALFDKFGIANITSSEEALEEAFSLLSPKNEKLQFEQTAKSNYNKQFEHGCDHLMKKFDENFKKAFN